LCHDALVIGRSEKIRHNGLKDPKLIDRLPVKKGWAWPGRYLKRTECYRI